MINKENIRKTMKLGDFLSRDWDCDIDVYDNVYDYIYPTYCGQKLTEEGKLEFSDILLLDCIVDINDHCVQLEIDIDSRKDYCRLHYRIEELFVSMAGDCSEADYDKWFVE